MKKLFQHGLAAALAVTLSIHSACAVNWGLWYGNGAGQPPTGEDSAQTLAQYGAYYMGSPEEKILYLTFDCGYENGQTAKILDTLKKHHVPAAFFVVGHYLDAAPALVKRMGDEGHLVCNHSLNHPNMSRVNDSRFSSELTDLAAQYKALTGRTIAPFYRPPEGSYTHENLRWAQALGYHTILWSTAYADWDPKKQPSYQNALATVRSRSHNGAIVLLHAVSSTNAEILSELIERWRAEGYTFQALSSLPGIPVPTVNAQPSTAQFRVVQTPFTPTTFLIGDVHYVKLRDAALALRSTGAAFSIDYDKDENVVHLTKGEPYQPLGTELSGMRDAAMVQALPSQQSMLLNGTPLTLDAYLIDGANYIKLRDLTELFDCEVTYDAETHTVCLNPPDIV